MAFVAPEDFVGPEYQIPNLDREGQFLAQAEVWEKEFLYTIMGRSLTDAFYAGILAATEQRWTDLQDGVAYSAYDKGYEWLGMKKMFIPYIYFKWVEFTIDNLSGSGVVTPKAENGEIASPRRRLVGAWNDFERKCGSACAFKDTLYGYLYFSDDLFTDSLGSGYTDIKTYLSDKWDDPGKMNLFDL